MPADPSDRARSLSQAQVLAAALALGPLLILGAVCLLPRRAESSALVVPAGLLGIVAPAIGWRLQAAIRGRARGGPAERRRAYVRSVIAGLAVTAAAALLGILAWSLSNESAALLGVLLHLLLVSALWPTEERLQNDDEEPPA